MNIYQKIISFVSEFCEYLSVGETDDYNLRSKAHKGNYIYAAVLQFQNSLHNYRLDYFLFFNFDWNSGKSFARLNLPSIIPLISIANDFYTTSQLNEFKLGVHLDRLCDNIESSRYEYIMRTAAMYKRAGYNVEFVPVSEIEKVKSPDIKIILNKQEIQIECKKKDIKPLSIRDYKDIELILSHINMDKHLDDGLKVDIKIFSIGKPNVSEFTQLGDFLAGKVEDGSYGLFNYSDRIIISIEEWRPWAIQERKHQMSAFLPMPIDGGNVLMQAKIDPDGRPVYNAMISTELTVFDINSITSIMNSFRVARKQFSPHASGIIHLELDMRNISSHRIEYCLNFIARIIEQKFNPSYNTRIAAVVLTTAPEIFVDEDLDLVSRVRIVKNRHHTFTKDFSIPIEYRFKLSSIIGS